MKVLLINPSWDAVVSGRGRRHNRAWPPLDLLSCAGLLECDGRSVDLIDARARAVPAAEIGRRARGYDLVFITSTPMDRWQCPNLDTDRFAETTRHLPADRTYVLGAHGTLMPERLLDLSGARGVVLGEPELAVQALCRNDHPTEVPGMVMRDNGSTHRTKERPLMELDTLPSPAFHLLDLDYYSYELLGDRFVLLEGSRGCPWSCHFCLLEMYGRRYRRRSPERVLEDVELAVEKHGARSAYFIDLEFTVDRKLVFALCEFLIAKQYDFRWCCQTRLDTVDPEMLQAMKASGCELIHYGVESGSERVLATLNKKITLEDIRQGMRVTHASGIDSLCFFMLGFPDETAEEMDQTVALAKELRPTYASFHIATPYPGTHFHSVYGAGAELPIGQSFAQTLPLEELERRVRRATRQYYARPSYVARHLGRGQPRLWARQVQLFWRLARPAH